MSWIAPVAALSLATAPPVSLDPLLAPFLKAHGLPALAAAVVRNGEVVAAGAVGTRRAGTDAPVTVDDRFHLGSDTKAMTALLAATHVEAGRLKWGSTVAEVLPDLAGPKDAGLRAVTLEQLLSHTSGVPADNDAIGALLDRAAVRDENLDAARRWLARQVADLPLASKPGTRFEYANMNYVVAGAMIERVGGKTWEEQVTDRVFVPLGLKTAGLGPQATVGRLDAPLGHTAEGGKLTAFLGGPAGDNPLVLGPAGTAHMSILDFARWAGWNAGRGRRGPALVRPDTLRKLHTPVIDTPARPDAKPGTPRLGRYALGWAELTAPWAAGPLLFHGGSNGKNIAQVYIDPARDLAVVLTTNVGGRPAEQALEEAVVALFAKYARPESNRD